MGVFLDWLNQIPFAGLMLVVALGFWLGRLQWRGLGLGPAGGTILIALVLGRLGLSFDGYYGTDDPMVTIGAFGFCLFIYSVGFEAGPRFFTSLFGGPGWRFVLVAAIVTTVALGLTVAAGHLFGFDKGVTAGLLAGALTSAPTYAAAAEAVGGDGNSLALTFAVTYPIGLAAVVLLVQFLPRMMNDNLRADIADHDGTEHVKSRPMGSELTRAFVVTQPEVIGPPLRDLDLTHATGCYVIRLRRGDEILTVNADTVFVQGDHVLVRGRFEELLAFAALVGPETYDNELRKKQRRPREIRVSQKDVVGKSLNELGIASRHHCLIQAVDRGGVHIEPTPELTLQRADVVYVVGPRDAVQKVADELGRFEPSTSETDIAVYAGGIFLGLLLGYLKLPLFGGSLTLGYAGGLLLVGVLLGRFRNLGIIHVHVPRPARQLVRDLGILLLVAEAGVNAGHGTQAGYMEGTLVPALGACLVVTTLTVVTAILVARWLLRLRPVDAWGSLGGGMTSSSALAAVRRAVDSNEASISYAAAYAVGSVLATIAGQVIVHLM